MDEPQDKRPRELGLIQLLPNMLTISAICAGLTAIRCGIEGSYTLAVQLIVLACILDGLDGRLARLLNSSSPLGAQLDSLADFLNFGVVPPLILYFWALQDTRHAAWIAVLVFAICAVLRLARFNVSQASDDGGGDSSFFTGVPSPAGALLVLLPMSVSFAFSEAPLLPDLLICLYMVCIGWLMISRVPTWSFKTTRISRDKAKYLILAGVFAGAAIVSYAWISLVVLCLCYILVVLWGLVTHSRKRKRA